MGDVDPEFEAEAQLVFATGSASTIVLDCVLIASGASDAEYVPAGWPFTLRLEGPDTPWFSVAVQSLLEAWADQGRAIHLSIRTDGSRPRARIRSYESQVVLDLAPATG